MQTGGSETLRQRDAVPALVLVPRVATGVGDVLKADPECGIAYWASR